MSTFRYKPNKDLLPINTLDTLHRKCVAKFDQRKEVLDKVICDIEKLDTELDSMNSAEIKLMIQKIKANLYSIKNDGLELDYYDNTNDILLDYYNDADQQAVINK